MAQMLKSEDRDILQWSREFSKKKIDLTLPRIRVQDYMQEDADQWIINATLNRLKSYAIQKYVGIGDYGEDLNAADRLDDDGDDYRDREISEIDISQYSYRTQDNVTISGSTLRPRIAKSTDTNLDLRSLEVLLPRTVEVRDDEDDDVYSREQDETMLERDRIFQEEIDQRVNEYLAFEHPDRKDYSSTVKLFSNSSIANSDETYYNNQSVELKKVEEIPVQTQAETLQEILLTPMPGPGFRMAQVAHPEAIFGQGRLPSVYFIRPRVRIFSAFPHCQQFWCRQGNPIPVPPPSKRNTFLDISLLSTNHPKVKSFPYRVRNYKANMSTFDAGELIFVVEGRNIFVTGEKRRENKVIRTVTEEICLPIDLDLNYIRVARTNKGEVIFEELWEYDSKTKAN